MRRAPQLVAVAAAVTLATGLATARLAAQPATPEPAPAQAPAPEPAPPAPDAVPEAPPSPAPAVEPPLVWTEWDVRPAPGARLLEDAATVRALLERDLETRQALTQSARDELVGAARQLGYFLVDIEEERPAPGVVRAVLILEPYLVVRRVDVEVDDFWRVAIQDELTRRMRLRVGETLEVDEEYRKLQLADEAERLREFLQDEGFFEAEVRIDVSRTGVYGAVVTVDTRLGPDYYVGKITIANEKDLAIRGDELRAVFDHCLWRPVSTCVWPSRFTRAQHQADLQKIADMYQKRGYPAVRVQSDFDPRTSFDRRTRTVDFTLRIDERRRLAVEFEGNDPAVFPDELLTAQLTFDAASSADDLEVAASARAIQLLYQQRGWFDAAVSWERTRTRIEDVRAAGRDRSLDQIVYRIDAGPRRRLRSIEIDGATAIPVDEVLEVIETRLPPSGFQLLGDTTSTTPDRLATDAERIVQRYRERGYLDAKVTVQAAPAKDVLGDAATTAALLAAGRDRGDLHVRFVVDEGQPTRIERIDVVFDGAHDATEDQILDRLRLDRGSPLLATSVQDARRRVESWYLDLGKMRATVAVDPEPIDGDPHRQALTFTIREGPTQKVGKIAVRGNFRTAKWVVLREFGLEEGDLLTTSAVGRGLRRLRATGLFAAVNAELIDLDETREESVNILLEVEERKDVTLFVDLEAGYSTQRDIYVGAAPVWPNVQGLGLTFEARALTSVRDTRYQSFEGIMRLPRWLMRRWVWINPDVDASVFARRQFTERFGDLTTFGGSVAASRVWQRAADEGGGRTIATTLRYDVRRRTRQEDAVRLAGNNGNISRSTVYNRTGTLGFTIAWDQRVDARGNLNPLAPHHGFKLETGVGFASPYLLSQDSFVKANALGQWIIPVTRRLQLRLEGRFDQGFPLGGAVLLPEVERFFGGGDETVRGYPEDRLAVEVVERPVPPLVGVTQIEVRPAGGNIRLLGSADLQVRLWEIGGIPLASALFIDAGAITNAWAALGPEDVRPSIGVALARALTPFGGLSLEWAVPVRPRDVDPPLGRLHFLVALRY